MANPFTTLETLIRSLVQSVSSTNQAVTKAVDGATTEIGAASTAIVNAIEATAPVTSSQPANQFLASPSTGAGTPGFRAIVTADIETAGDSRYAQLAGSASQLFAAANGTSGNDVVNYQQVAGQGPISFSVTAGTALNTNYDATVTFTAPSDGVVHIASFFGVDQGVNSGVQANFQIIINGTGVGDDAPLQGFWFESGQLSVSAGATVTAIARTSYTSGTPVTGYMRGYVEFTPTP